MAEGNAEHVLLPEQTLNLDAGSRIAAIFDTTLIQFTVMVCATYYSLKLFRIYIYFNLNIYNFFNLNLKEFISTIQKVHLLKTRDISKPFDRFVILLLLIYTKTRRKTRFMKWQYLLPLSNVQYHIINIIIINIISRNF